MKVSPNFFEANRDELVHNEKLVSELVGIINAPVHKLSEAVKLFLANFFGYLKLLFPVILSTKELNGNLVLSWDFGQVNST